LGTGGTTVGGGTCAAAQVTDNKRAAIAKKQERITFMTLSAARLLKFCSARLQHQMSDCRAVVRPASGHVLLESLHQRGPYYDRMKAVSLARLSASGPVHRSPRHRAGFSRGHLCRRSRQHLLANPLWHEARSRAAFAAKTSSRELMASGTTEDSSSSTSFPHFSRQILANCLSVSCVQTINSLPPHVHKGAGG
jgi:hypothetical protein